MVYDILKYLNHGKYGINEPVTLKEIRLRRIYRLSVMTDVRCYTNDICAY